MAPTDPTLSPPKAPKLYTGYHHLARCLSRIVPTQMHKTQTIRRHALLKLSKGKF